MDRAEYDRRIDALRALVARAQPMTDAERTELRTLVARQRARDEARRAAPPAQQQLDLPKVA